MRDEEYLGTANQPKKEFLVNRRWTRMQADKRAGSPKTRKVEDRLISRHEF
jgi:hypothetical protein